MTEDPNKENLSAATSELPKAYVAKDIESKWYAFWEENAYFHAQAEGSTKPPYCIVIPPPNVTGVLHMGHALVNTLQDILIRWKRMCGYEVLWVPGTDHAGIATQTVVERHLMKTTGKKRKDFGREEFLQHVWKWKEDSEQRIVAQMKRLGCSCDWERQRFTMDEGNNQAVRTMFKKMFDENLIYRGDYLVNWDPVTQTALADDEVEYEEIQSSLWHFRYPLADGSGWAVIATTRPETMLGDVAVAVSPRDSRYAHLVGKMIALPLSNRQIPIIADHHVDPAFGSGMVKITPAHDPNDYQIGLRHNLPFITMMTPDGKINENGGSFQGMSMAEGRLAVVAKMQSLGLVEKIDPHTLRIGLSYRSKAVIEPFLSKQWFVRMQTFAVKLKSAVQEGRVKIIPKKWESVYFHWVDNLRDWCISRQLWWGHRIPIWYHKDDPGRMLCSAEAAIPEAVAKNPDEWVQDEDVLDTWFSSGLWPFAALGWPEKTPELQTFYPNAVLVTGHDILFFWVARMILMGEYALGQVPFPETFLHGLIYGKSYWRDAPQGGIVYVNDQERLDYDLGKPLPKDVHMKWEKMSKSKGNIIDPLELIDQYGTDALRMGLCASSPQSHQIDLDRRRIEEFKNFANKLWNGARFVFMHLEGDALRGLTPLSAAEFSCGLDESLLSLEDRWILSVLARTVQNVNAKLGNYAFDQAAVESYDFFWKEFCAYYLEIVKPVLFGKQGSLELRKNKQKLLCIVLCQAIRLMHPMAPFITEEIFQLLKKRLAAEDMSHIVGVDPYTAEAVTALQTKACLIAAYPTVLRASDADPSIERTFEIISRAVYTIRNIRGEMKLAPNISTDIHFVVAEEDAYHALLREHGSLIQALVPIQRIEMHAQEPQIGFASVGVLDSVKIMIPLPLELVKQEEVRLKKEQEKLTKALEKLREQLANPELTQRAQFIEKQRTMCLQTEKELAAIEQKLALCK